ncbi:TetR/AcrR family transcriptional regulator [Nitrospirillum sp. BR 11164]|uniref:TetR/AcrR family transcriptional regulator n=1 Tax=Nitrospirillum sp. BR 11164 TaxID=3104324 RepID=UPI002AFF27E4|nr:TetR/AcrR family transcriptional regulator [Nitrospirillum sp. BR 11164]MEA1650013.1 TetR/AcrR family transcriptional regulator [Nitrospirillum sp. BR 11164]
MARPKSEEKRDAILAAAVRVIADQGLGAPTARIASLAGVAEGTLFTYFATKDLLLNQLYLALKADLRQALMTAYPADGPLRDRVRHIWDRYVDWGVRDPARRRAMAQLIVSDRLTPETRALGSEGFARIDSVVQEGVGQGLMRDQPPDFVAAILTSLAETTMDFILRQPDSAERYRAAGFDALWNAISR